MRRSLAITGSLAALALVFPCVVFAATKPPEITSSIHATSPVGSGELNKMLFHVYDASFWSDQGATLKAPYALSITYDMDFTKDDLVDRTVTELKHVSNLSADKLQQDATLLKTIWPDISKGDRITAFTPDGKQTVFYYNGKNAGKIADAEFTSAFFGIWLSEKSSEPQMRKELLGQ